MARGYPGAFGHKLNAPYVWLPLALVFLLGLLDWRRPFRIAHLDLLVLLSFGISNHFLTRAEIGWSVPLAYPPLIYLLGEDAVDRLSRPRHAADGRPRDFVPRRRSLGLAIATVLLLGARVGLNLTSDHSVIDVGYAGVIGADRIRDRRPALGRLPRGQPLRRHLRPGQLPRLRPLRGRLPVVGRVGRPPGRPRGGDLLRPRDGGGPVPARAAAPARRGGRDLGVIMAFAWAAYPYTTYALQSNSNDALVAALLVWALVLFARPVARGSLLALAGMAKFAPLALAPLFAAGERGLLERVELGQRLRTAPLRPLALFSAAFVGVTALMLVHPAVDAGLATFWDRTLESQLERESPVLDLGAGELAGVAPDPAEGVRGRPRGAGRVRPAAALAAAAGRARSRGDDRGPAHRRALVLPLHPLVPALAPGGPGRGKHREPRYPSERRMRQDSAFRSGISRPKEDELAERTSSTPPSRPAPGAGLPVWAIVAVVAAAAFLVWLLFISGDDESDSVPRAWAASRSRRPSTSSRPRSCRPRWLPPAIRSTGSARQPGVGLLRGDR